MWGFLFSMLISYPAIKLFDFHTIPPLKCPKSFTDSFFYVYCSVYVFFMLLFLGSIKPMTCCYKPAFFTFSFTVSHLY